MKELLKNNHIKLFQFIEKNSSANFVLKISGIWETITEYGLTFKFCFVDKSFYFG